jgi:lysophospholipase L1-like esterase
MRTLAVYLLIIFLSLSFFSFQGEGIISADPDPARFQSEIDLFVAWDQKNSYPLQAILFIGSSSIRMWPTRQSFPDFPVINRGFGGAHTSDLIYFYDQIVQPYDAAVVVFYAGDNDIADGKTAEKVFEDYSELVTRILRDKPLVKFIYLPVKPSPSRFSFWKEMNRLNLMIKEYNDKNLRLFYVDVATPLLDSNTVPDKKFFTKDLLHLSEAGYAQWQKILAPHLQELYLK